MRILHVLGSLRQTDGGPIRAVLDFSARAADFGLECEVLGFGALDVPDNPLEAGHIHALPVSVLRRYSYSPRLRQWLRENLGRFQGVVLHGMWLYPHWAVSSECLKKNVPYACYPQGMLEPWAFYGQTRWKALKKFLYWNFRERKIICGAQCLYFATNRERELAQNTFHLGGMDPILPTYGVDVTCASVSTPANQTLLQPCKTKVALFLGRVHPKKNIGLLIEAWHLARPPRQWHLVIAGSGDDAYMTQLRKLVSKFDLGEQVQFVGFVTGKDKSYLLQRASWFLLPSQQENFGVAVLEAITHDCPVVISDQVFVAESLHKRSEVLPLNVDAWVKFMKERMTDDDWRDELAGLDKQHLMEKMNMETVAQAWVSTLSATFANRPFKSSQTPLAKRVAW